MEQFGHLTLSTLVAGSAIRGPSTANVQVGTGQNLEVDDAPLPRRKRTGDTSSLTLLGLGCFQNYTYGAGEMEGP